MAEIEKRKKKRDTVLMWEREREREFVRQQDVPLRL